MPTLLIELKIPSKYGDTFDCVKLIRKWLEQIDTNKCFLAVIHVKSLTEYTHSEVNEIYCKNCPLNPLNF